MSLRPTTMVRFTPACGAVLLVVLTAGCGSARPGSDPVAPAPMSNAHRTVPTTPSSTLTSTSPLPRGPQSYGPPARSVVLHRTGGLKPVELTRVFAMNRPPPKGFSRDDVKRVLEAAAVPELRPVAMTPGPSGTCCDFYSYRIVITLTDGSRVSFVTDGRNAPPMVARLLRLVL